LMGIAGLVVLFSVMLLIDMLLTASGYHQRRVRLFSAVPDGFSHAALWLLGAWVLGMFVATPLYHPYPRLVLPLLVGSWLAYGMMVPAIIHQRERRDSERLGELIHI